MTLSDLITAVERAERPSREIDAAVFAHFFAGGAEAFHHGVNENVPAGWVILKPETGTITSAESEPFTASIDAVVALIRRQMPGASNGYSDQSDHNVTAFVGDAIEVCRPTPALALLLAFLRAARARQENDNG